MADRDRPGFQSISGVTGNSPTHAFRAQVSEDTAKLFQADNDAEPDCVDLRFQMQPSFSRQNCGRW